MGDTLWLKRLAKYPARFVNLEPVKALPMLKTLDDVFTAMAAERQDSHLDKVLEYTSTKGIQGSKNLFGVLMHIFNHQTHHRGQATALLTQQGLDLGATDLLLLLPNLSA